jgi:hypothetical protein
VAGVFGVGVADAGEFVVFPERICGQVFAAHGLDAVGVGDAGFGDEALE